MRRSFEIPAIQSFYIRSSRSDCIQTALGNRLLKSFSSSSISISLMSTECSYAEVSASLMILSAFRCEGFFGRLGLGGAGFREEGTSSASLEACCPAFLIMTLEFRFAGDSTFGVEAVD